jgi:hypothetical protein
LITRECSGRSTDLLNARKGEEGEGIIKGGIRRNPWNTERRRSCIAQRGSNNIVAATRVAQTKVIERASTKGMGLIENNLLSAYVGETSDIICA